MAIERIVIMDKACTKAYLIREEVIRCKECKFYKPKVGWCVRNGIQPVSERDFCSKAERRSK